MWVPGQGSGLLGASLCVDVSGVLVCGEAGPVMRVGSGGLGRAM